MKRKINGGLLIVMAVLIIIVYYSLKDVLIKNAIEKNGTEIIVKYTSKVKFPKTTDFNFIYFVAGEKLTTANSGINYSILNSKKETEAINNLKINCFYLAKYTLENPKVIKVNPLKQITDTTAILQAGFKKGDFEN